MPNRNPIHCRKKNNNRCTDKNCKRKNPFLRDKTMIVSVIFVYPFSFTWFSFYLYCFLTLIHEFVMWISNMYYTIFDISKRTWNGFYFCNEKTFLGTFWNLFSSYFLFVVFLFLSRRQRDGVISKSMHFWQKKIRNKTKEKIFSFLAGNIDGFEAFEIFTCK